MYRYELIRKKYSSEYFGKCEICGKHCNKIYHQIEEREFKPDKYTRYKCFDHFGHKNCLILMRKNYV